MVVSSTASDDGVRSALREMLESGSQPPPRITAAELRRRAERRRLPHVDAKALIALAAAMVLIVALVSAGPFRARRTVNASGGTRAAGVLAHSAYGVQVAVPTSWSVEVFGLCPDGRRPGTLFIGTSQFTASCPNYSSDTTVVSIWSTSGGSTTPTFGQSYRLIHVNGLTVLASTAGVNDLVTGGHWYLPAKHVTIAGTGPKALAIMRTLAPATQNAVPANGFVSGTERLDGVLDVPESGPIRVSKVRSRATKTLGVLHGQYSFTAGPGRYALTASNGSIRCPTVFVTVVSGQRVTAPPLVCDGY
jgi:hypothetical protein